MERTPLSDRSLLFAAWRYRWLVLSAALLGALLGVAYVVIRPPIPVYSASSTMVLQAPEPFSSGSDERFIANQLEILRSIDVADRTSELLAELRPPIELRSEVIVASLLAVPQQGTVVRLTYRASDERMAVEAVNTAVQAYREISRQELSAAATEALDRLDAQTQAVEDRINALDQEIAVFGETGGISLFANQIESAVNEMAALIAEYDAPQTSDERRVAIDARLSQLRTRVEIYRSVQALGGFDPGLSALVAERETAIERRAQLLERRDQIAVDSALSSDVVQYSSLAQFGVPSASLSRGRAIAGGLILGFVVGVGAAYVLVTRRRTLSHRFEPEAVLGVPLLADIPHFGYEDMATTFPARDAPRSAAAEGFRFAAGALEVTARDKNLRTVAVLSATLGHGKTTVVANLAVATAHHGKRVAVVDGDFGSQALTGLLTGHAVTVQYGLTDVIVGSTGLEEAMHQVYLGNGVSIDLLSRGGQPEVAGEILRSSRVKDVFERLGSLYDVVIVDAPPLLQVAYAATLLTYVDGVIVAVAHDSSVAELSDLADRLRFIGADVLGYVYNFSPLRREMTQTEGSMHDVLGDRFLLDETEAEPVATSLTTNQRKVPTRSDGQ